MEDRLKVAIIQSNLVWENKNQNLANFESHLIRLQESVDLIILPEMFTTGFSMNASTQAEAMDGPTVLWLKKVAKWKQACITGSIIIKDNNEFYNRMMFFYPDETYEYYDKRHLFRLAKEHEVFTEGKARQIVRLKKWRINLNVCYDLRFPVWTRNRQDYDVLINVANWPSQRIDAWDALLKARAIENQVFVLACNRIGKDPKGNNYSGHSSIVDYSGIVLKQAINEEAILIHTLEKSAQQSFTQKLAFYKDQDEFDIQL